MTASKQSLPHKIYILSRHKKVLLVIAIFLTISILGYLFTSNSISRLLKNAEKKELFLKSKLANTRQTYLKYNILKKNINVLNNVYAEQSKILTSQLKVGDVLNLITQISENLNLKIVYLRPQPEKKLQNYSETSIKIALLGNYHDMAKFVSAIANIKTIITTHDFSIKRANSNRPVLAMHITLKIYHKYIPAPSEKKP